MSQFDYCYKCKQPVIIVCEEYNRAPVSEIRKEFCKLLQQILAGNNDIHVLKLATVVYVYISCIKKYMYVPNLEFLIGNCL